MAKVEKGGTDIWCPHCKQIQTCRADNPSTHGVPSGQRWRRGDHTDIQWFRRGRTCTACYRQWLTAEVPEQFLDELVALRDSLSKLKTQAATVLASSLTTSESLAQLETSLKALSALD
jgi:hypothetical protein